jgi:hypothetical protein
VSRPDLASAACPKANARTLIRTSRVAVGTLTERRRSARSQLGQLLLRGAEEDFCAEILQLQCLQGRRDDDTG